MATASSGPIVLLFPTFIRTTWTCIFLVHSNLAGLMIGKGGDRIAALRRDFNVQVQLAKPPEVQYVVLAGASSVIIVLSIMKYQKILLLRGEGSSDRSRDPSQDC